MRIDLDMSELIPVGAVTNVDALAAELGCCCIGSLPSTCLGLPLGTSYKPMVVWDRVEERITRKLASWMRRFISKGERVMLIKSTLASFPV